MQLQHVGSDPTVISITQLRQDIDVLEQLLEKYGRATVLKGTKVFFNAVDPDFEEKKAARVRKAVEGIRKIAKEMAEKAAYKQGQKHVFRIE